MSRIGQLPIQVPSGVTLALDGLELTVKGQKGELNMTLFEEVLLELEDNVVTMKLRDDSKRSRSRWGLQRSLVNNMVIGVSDGFTIDLEIRGVGYRASVDGRTLKLQLGYSHDIEFAIPDGIEIQCDRPTMIRGAGADRQRVGQVAAEIRAFRKPEPYKGKGVRYRNEYVFQKEGKKK